MAIFRHYKNKFYRTLATVRHSETEEELVLYKPILSSDLWVRPRKMFFEDIEAEGTKMPRFAPVDFKIEIHSSVTLELRDRIENLMGRIFAKNEIEKFRKKLSELDSSLWLVARIDNVDAAFKGGYPQDQQTFYSWMGGVAPEWRGAGVAQRLMREQHHWCRENGYKTVETRTRHMFPQMLMLNVQAGFKIVDVVHNADGEDRIVMRKNLVT